MNQIGKTNVTMWKNREAQKREIIPSKSRSNQKTEKSNKIENDFIDYLKKQIYFYRNGIKTYERTRKRNSQKWRIYSII